MLAYSLDTIGTLFFEIRLLMLWVMVTGDFFLPVALRLFIKACFLDVSESTFIQDGLPIGG